jgi:hypothetical protein
MWPRQTVNIRLWVYSLLKLFGIDFHSGFSLIYAGLQKILTSLTIVHFLWLFFAYKSVIESFHLGSFSPHTFNNHKHIDFENVLLCLGLILTKTIEMDFLPSRFYPMFTHNWSTQWNTLWNFNETKWRTIIVWDTLRASDARLVFGVYFLINFINLLA